MGSMSTQLSPTPEAPPIEDRFVLVVDGDNGRGNRLLRECRAAGLECQLAPHGAAALEIALAEHPAVVVAQLNLPLVDALALAEIIRANPRTRTASFLFLGAGESIASRSAIGDRLLPGDTPPQVSVENIEQLFARQDRVDLVDSASREGEPVSGSLADLPLADLLESLLIQGGSGQLSLSRSVDDTEAGECASVVIRDGDVIQAHVGIVEGEKALFRLLTWCDGRYEFIPGESEQAQGILTPTRKLLLEGLRQIAEWDRLSTHLPPLASPVELTLSDADLPNIVHPLTQEVLLLLELYSTVGEVVDRCSFPDYQVLRTLNTLADREIVQLGRVADPAPPPAVESKEPIFSETQVRRLRDWLKDSGARQVGPADAKLLVVASSNEGVRELARLLSEIPGFEPVPESELSSERLGKIGRLAVDDQLGIELINAPNDSRFESFLPVAGHAALGTLFLLDGCVSESAQRVARATEVLGRLPRVRMFHVVLLRKGERVGPDELRENLSLIDEASLFLLPIEDDKNPTSLVRSLFARVIR
jgi:CheY-like chemotaxis protein